MHLSVSVFATDLLPHKKSFTEALVSSNRKNLFKNCSLHQYFEKIKSAGIEGIELLIPADFSEQEINEVKKILEENSMPVLSIHQPLRLVTKTDLKEIEMLFSAAKQFNVKVIVMHLQNARSQIFNKEYVETLHKLEDEYQIKIGFENTQKFGQIINKRIYWEQKAFSDILKKTGFSITLDITHLGNVGGDPISFFNDNKEQIINIHLSDYKKIFFVPLLHLQLGKGRLPIQKFLETIKENSYDGLITLEIKADLEGLCNSARLIRQVV